MLALSIHLFLYTGETDTMPGKSSLAFIISVTWMLSIHDHVLTSAYCLQVSQTLSLEHLLMHLSFLLHGGYVFMSIHLFLIAKLLYN